MVTYILELVLIWLFGVLLYKKAISKKSFIIISVILLSLILGLRGVTVGEDTQSYINIFKYISRIPWVKILTSGISVVYNTTYGFDSTIEVGFAILNKLVSIFTRDPQWILLICAFITNILVGRFILRTSNDVFTAVYIYMCECMYMQTFNAMRQLLAIAIAIQAYELIKNKRYIYGTGIILLACCFHMSALVMFGLFPIMMVKNQRKAMKYIFAGAALVIFSVPLMQYITNRFLQKYTAYFTVNYWEISARGQALLWITEIIICVFLYFRHHNEEMDLSNCYIAISGTLIYLAFEIIGLRISIFQRIALYYNIFIVFLFPCFLQEFKKSDRFFLNAGLCFVLTVAFLNAASSPVRLYHFFWQ